MQVDDEISFAVTQPAKRAKVDPGNKIHNKCLLQFFFSNLFYFLLFTKFFEKTYYFSKLSVLKVTEFASSTGLNRVFNASSMRLRNAS